MQAAPNVSITVNRHPSIALLLALLWFVDVGIAIWVIRYSHLSPYVTLALAVLYSCLAWYLFSLYQKLFCGKIQWDGRYWHIGTSNQTLRPCSQLQVLLDFGWLLLLRAERNTLLCLFKKDYSQHDWLATRRALFYSNSHTLNDG
jgi:hypothetical protein